MRFRAFEVLAGVGLLTTGCPVEDIVANRTDVGARSDGGTTDSGPIAGYCAGQGPPILVGDRANLCAGNVAETTFRFALCACDGWALSAPLATDAFDSREGPYRTGRPGGAVGANARVAFATEASVGGSLWVSSGGVGLSEAPLDVGQDLLVGGDLAGGADVTVARNAQVAGRVQLGALTVGGSLTLTPTSTLDIDGVYSVGEERRAPVSVPDACGCAPSSLVDIDAFVRRHAAANDNALAGVGPDDLASVDGAVRYTVPCGRYYFDRVSGSGRLTLVVEGRAAVFVRRDISLEGGLEIELGPEAEIDLFVGGNVVSGAPLALGSAERPAAARLYVGGSGTLQLSGGGSLGGNVYAPRAELVVSGPLEVFGSVFVRRLSASDRVDLHYDTAVLTSGEDCPEPPPSMCTSCFDCRNQACTNGACGDCQVDADCCAPLTCETGRCTTDA